jgi:hypothetical protein
VDRLADLRMLLEDEHSIAEPSEFSCGVGPGGAGAHYYNVMHRPIPLFRNGETARKSADRPRSRRPAETDRVSADALMSQYSTRRG